jgi:predicted lipoprotein
LAGLVACSGGGGATATDARAIDFDRPAMLANIGANIVLPTVRNVAAGAAALATQVEEYCGTLGADGEAAALAAAQDGWRAVMSEWQVAEAMRFGPAAMDNNTLGARIYSWPIVSSCAVDQDVMLRFQDVASYDVDARLNNRRGLDALEYLLFAESLETTCAPQIAPVGWDDLSESDKRIARCGLAAAVAADVAAQTQAVRDAWEPAQGNYLADFAGAGTAGSSFASVQIAVNVVSDALFYLDAEVKDQKLGEPAGIMLNTCNTVQQPCLAEIESPFAHHSKENAASNLRGFAMLLGGAGPGQDPSSAEALGFADFLRAAGAEDLADTMTEGTSAAIAAIEAIPGTMASALSTDYQTVAEAHARIKAVTDLMKSQFLTVLGLDFPDGAAGDND